MICLITISETGWLREAHIGQVTLCVVADFFILPPYRGNGLRKALFSSIMNCSQFRVRRLMINTMGSEKYGDAFEPVTDAKTPIGQPGTKTGSLVLATDLVPHAKLQGWDGSRKDMWEFVNSNGIKIQKFGVHMHPLSIQHITQSSRTIRSWGIRAYLSNH
jgi:hypothetical protein